MPWPLELEVQHEPLQQGDIIATPTIMSPSVYVLTSCELNTLVYRTYSFVLQNAFYTRSKETDFCFTV